MTYLSVLFDSYQTITRQASRDKWDRDDTSTSWTLTGVQIVPEGSYFDVIVPFEVKEGDPLHVVYAIYSTGDSFGQDDGACKEVIDVFKTLELANDCHRAVEKYERGEKKVSWIREDGSCAKLEYVPWSGYFESLDYVRCETVEAK